MNVAHETFKENTANLKQASRKSSNYSVMVSFIPNSHINCEWLSWRLTKGGLKRGGAREVECVTELVWVLAPAAAVTAVG